MKHQRTLIGLLLFVLIMIVALMGCTEQNTQDLSPSAASVKAILAKADNIDSMYYEINGSLNVTSFAAQVLSIQVWNKDPYLKENISLKAIGIPFTLSIIQRPEGTYVYNVFTKHYELNTSIPSYVTAFKYIDPAMIKDLLNNQSIADFDTVVLDGKQTTLLNYTVPLQGGNSIKITVWIWNDRGVPLKALLVMNTQTPLNLDVRFNNYHFDTVQDSEFTIY